MISAFLLLIAACSGFLAVASGYTCANEGGSNAFAWIAIVFMVCSMVLSFIAGVLS